MLKRSIDELITYLIEAYDSDKVKTSNQTRKKIAKSLANEISLDTLEREMSKIEDYIERISNYNFILFEELPVHLETIYQYVRLFHFVK